MFTAGNIKWTLGKDPSYLATKYEVLDHFAHCLYVIRQRVRVDEFFGWDMKSDEETDGVVRIRCRSSDGRILVVETKRLIKAYGIGVMPNDPLEVSSTRVQSVSPDFCDMRGDDMRASDTPVWVIGGGKTGMDTAHALITEYPGREVNLVAGSGTFFTTRDRFFPTGVRRPRPRTKQFPKVSTTWSWTTSWMPSTAPARLRWCYVAEPPKRSNGAAG